MGCRTGVALSMSRSAVTLKTRTAQALAKVRSDQGASAGRASRLESSSADQLAPSPLDAVMNPAAQESD